MKVTAATYITGHTIRLTFSNNEQMDVDLYPWLMKAKNPMSTQFRDIEKFKTFQLHNGWLTWNWQMDLDADWLYNYATQLKPA